MKCNKVIIGSALCVSFLLKAVILLSQNSTSQIWYTYNQQAIINKKWGYTFDVNHRTGMTNNMQPVISAIRFGGIYLLDEEHRISGGYAWFGGHLNNNKNEILDENRLWQQYQTFHQSGKINFFHRFRVEERWREQLPINGEENGEYYFQVRGRYMFQAQGKITKQSKTKGMHVWWQIATEVMLQAGEGIDQHYFDQWRLVGGPVFQFSQSLSLATLYQYINQYRIISKNHQNIHSVRFTLLHSLDFSKNKKGNTVNEPIPSVE